MDCFLGFDGGGSKTECVAINASGHILSRARGPASNPTRIGFPAALAGITQAAESALRIVESPLEIAALCAGLAGTGTDENRAAMEQLLQQSFPHSLVAVRTDLEVPLSAMPTGAAIVLIAGTGSAAVGRDASGNIRRAGGLGPATGDEGSAFAIGRAAIAAVLHDDSPAASNLARQILRHLGAVNWAELDARVVAHADNIYPRVFPVVAAAADSGNPLAQSLLQSAAEDLAAIAEQLDSSLDLREQAFPLGKTGGTVNRSQFFDQAIDHQLRLRFPYAVITDLHLDPANVAAKIALQLYQQQNGAHS